MAQNDPGMVSAPPRSAALPWLLPQRSERSLGRLRLALGFCLAVYFAAHALYTPPLIALSPQWHSLVTTALPVPLRVAFSLCALLCVGAAAGRFARASALLLLLLWQGLVPVLQPLSGMDERLVPVTLFWLVLMPMPRPGQPSSDPQADGSATPLPGPLPSLWLLQIFVLYLSAPEFAQASPRFLPQQPALGMMVGICGLYCIPWQAGRIVALGLQVALHGYLFVEVGMPLTNGIMLCSALLLYGPEPAARLTSRLSGSFGRVTLAPALGMAYTLLFLLTKLAAFPVSQATGNAARHVLGDLGLASPSANRRDLGIALHFEPEHRGSVELQELAGLPPLQAQRTQLLLSYLVPSASDGAFARALASSLVVGVSERFCEDATRRGVSTRLIMRSHVLRQERKLTDFRCESNGSVTRGDDAAEVGAF